MPESVFLQTIADFLVGPAGLVPAPARVGLAVPVTAAEAPAIVLSLTDVRRIPAASRATEPSREPLLREEAIDLANPVRPGAPEISLLSADRRELLLGNGGLVRADGAEGSLSAGDISVRVVDVPFTPVRLAERGGEVGVEAANGRLRFAQPLPGSGLMRVRYFVAAAERQVTWLQGTLLLSLHAQDAAIVESLSIAATRALLRAPPAGLRELTMESLSAIGAPDPLAAQIRARSARFRFQFEHVQTTPAGGGDRIRQIPITTHVGRRDG